MSDLKGKVAIITGAGAGMGKAHAELMAERGAIVVAQDIDGKRAEAVADLLRKKGATSYAIACDVADTVALTKALSDIVKICGRVDILVNNAGIGGEPVIEDTTEEHFDRMFAVHVRGSFFAGKAVIPMMKQQKSGKIINISSIWGMVGHHYASPYCAAKAALLGLTKAWAKELAP